MVIMAFLSLFFGATAGKFAASAASGLSANLREAIYANIQTFSFSNIDKFSVPGLVTRHDDRYHQRPERVHDGHPRRSARAAQPDLQFF